MRERVVNVLGVDDVPFHLFAGCHVPKDAARDLFVIKGEDRHPTVLGSSSQDLQYRCDRGAFPTPVLKVKEKAPAQDAKYAWAPGGVA